MRIYPKTLILLLLSSLSYSTYGLHRLSDAPGINMVQDTTLAHQYFTEGDSVLEAGYFEQATDFYERAATGYRAFEAWDKVAKTYERIARCYSKLGLDSLSLSMSNKILDECRPYLDSNHVEIAKAHTMKGSTLTYLGQFQDAISNFKKAEAIVGTHEEANHLVLANVFSGLGTVKHFQRDLDSAVIYYKQSLEVRRSGFGEFSAKTAWCYTAIGLAYYEIGNNNQAFQHLKKSQEINTKLIGEDHPNQAGTYQVLGAVMANLGNYEQAFIYLEKAVKLVQSTLGQNHPWAAEILNAIAKYHIDLEDYGKASQKLQGIIENTDKDHGLEQLFETHLVLCRVKNKLGKYEEALENGRLALNAWQRREDSDSTKVANLYFEYSYIYEQKDDLENAIAYAAKSLSIYNNHLSEKNVSIAAVANHLANLYIKQGLYEEARETIEHAENANNISLNEGSKSSVSEATKYLSQKHRLSSIRLRAKYHYGRYEENADPADLEAAQMAYADADALIQDMRLTLNQVEDKMKFLRLVPEIYEEAIEVNYQRFKTTENEIFVTGMFNYSERNKSSILKESTLATEAIKFSGVPDSLIDKDVTIKAKLSQARSEYQKLSTTADEKDSAMLNHYKNEIFDLNLEQEQLRETFKTDYPKYYDQTLSKDLLGLDQIQDKLDNNATLLEYFIGDRSIYTFVVTQSQLFVHRQPKPEALADTIARFQQAIVDSDFESYYTHARSIYELLIEPVSDKLTGNRLIIIPDGALWHLSFELLLSADRNTVHYHELDYLLNDYAIGYGYSADFYARKPLMNKKASPQKTLLAFSFSDESSGQGEQISLRTLRDNPADLPGSREEIKAISELIDGEYFYGDLAGEAEFKKNATDYAILHLAIHGIVDEKYPMNSRLYFTPNGDSIHDNALYAYELYNMSLNSDLAVLSACNTGSGQVARGEGIMSLGRAFTYAGCKSLVLTQWAVPDETTPQIMKTFYKGLKDGLTKDVALQQAKLEYLQTNQGPKSSPMNWGAFVVLGDVSEVKLDDNHNFLIVGLIIGALLLILVIRNRKSS